MNFSPEKKIAGVLAPLFALRSEDDLGVGDIGTLRDFIDWVAESGFRLVQMLPINEIGGDNSPYNAISSRALEPTTLRLAPGSPEELTPEDSAAVIANENLETLRRGPVKWARVRKLKQALLDKAYQNFERNGSAARRQAFAQFWEREKAWLDDYATFRALMKSNGESEKWDSWLPDQRDPQSARVWLGLQAEKERGEIVTCKNFVRYVQWIADEQWRAVHLYATERGVALMGDIPFGVSYYSADVWAQRAVFRLDWSGGAPPEPYFKDDEFTMKWGQNWGIPLYDWPAMRTRDFAWWRQRARGVKRIFHLFRIDHVLGFYRIYAFPWRPERNSEFLPLSSEEMQQRTGGRAPHFAPRDDESAENCAANQREGEEYLRVVLAESGSTQVVGEDLGTVPSYVRPSLKTLGIAGFKIPQWEVQGGRVTPGAEYEQLAVATYATHDHKPIRQLWAEAHDASASTRDQSAEDLRKIAQFAGIEPREGLDFERDFYPAILRALFASNAWIAIVMITDLLARRDRFNIPGTAGAGNWTRRLPESMRQLRTSCTIRKRLQLVQGLIKETRPS